jgi:hypothetical protein
MGKVIILLFAIMLIRMDECSEEFLKDDRGELVQLIMMVRNGARFPQLGPVYDNLTDDQKSRIPVSDFSDEVKNEIIQDELTGNGIRQTYLLGMLMQQKKEYANFIDKTLSNLNQLHILASNTNKTIQAAQAFVLGLFGDDFDKDPLTVPSFYQREQYNASSEQTIGEDTALPNGYYPFDIKTSSRTKNFLFRPFDTVNCRAFNNFGQNLVSTDIDLLNDLNNIINQQKKNTLKDIRTKIIQESNKIRNFDEDDSVLKETIDIHYFADFLKCMKNLGQTFEMKEEDYDKIQNISNYLKSVYFFQTRGSTVQLNYLIKEINNRISTVVPNFSEANPSPDPDTQKKLVIYSLHDINIWAFLNNFNFISSCCLHPNKTSEHKICIEVPDFAANLIFEIRKLNDKHYIGKT